MTISWAVGDPSDLKYKWRTPIPQSIMDARPKNAFIFICLYWVWTIPNQTIHNYTTVSILHNQPAEWSLLEQGSTQRSQKIEGHLLFWLFCVAPFCCAVNCFRKKCGKETWDLKAAITTSSCSFEPMIPQLEALWGITPGICLKQSVFGLVHHKHSKHIHKKDRARKENTQMDAEKKRQQLWLQPNIYICTKHNTNNNQ